MHKAQVSALLELRDVKQARFSELLRTTNMTSDNFKFHIRKLMALGYLVKESDGRYALTARGKEFTNRLDEATGREILQPKSSMLMIVSSKLNGKRVFLAHHRTREPFFGFWGIASAPVLRGVPLLESAAHELKKQTGIEAQFKFRGTLRVIDKNPDGEVLEDKLFSLLYVELPEPTPPRRWRGGDSLWLTESELLSKDKLFRSTQQTLALVYDSQPFSEAICVYTEEEY